MRWLHHHNPAYDGQDNRNDQQRIKATETSIGPNRAKIASACTPANSILEPIIKGYGWVFFIQLPEQFTPCNRVEKLLYFNFIEIRFELFDTPESNRSVSLESTSPSAVLISGFRLLIPDTPWLAPRGLDAIETSRCPRATP